MEERVNTFIKKVQEIKSEQRLERECNESKDRKREREREVNQHHNTTECEERMPLKQKYQRERMIEIKREWSERKCMKKEWDKEWNQWKNLQSKRKRSRNERGIYW